MKTTLALVLSLLVLTLGCGGGGHSDPGVTVTLDRTQLTFAPLVGAPCATKVINATMTGGKGDDLYQVDSTNVLDDKGKPVQDTWADTPPSARACPSAASTVSIARAASPAINRHSARRASVSTASAWLPTARNSRTASSKRRNARSKSPRDAAARASMADVEATPER